MATPDRSYWLMLFFVALSLTLGLLVCCSCAALKEMQGVGSGENVSQRQTSAGVVAVDSIGPTGGDDSLQSQGLFNVQVKSDNQPRNIPVSATQFLGSAPYSSHATAGVGNPTGMGDPNIVGLGLGHVGPVGPEAQQGLQFRLNPQTSVSSPIRGHQQGTGNQSTASTQTTYQTQDDTLLIVGGVVAVSWFIGTTWSRIYVSKKTNKSMRELKNAIRDLQNSWASMVVSKMIGSNDKSKNGKG